MKILTVGYLHGAGGAERQIILLSNQLAKRGHDVTLCVLSEYKSKYKIDESVHIVDLTSVEGGRLSILKRFLAFRKFVVKMCPDFIVNYNLQSAYFCLAIPKKCRGKVIYAERGDPYDAEYSGLLGKIRDITVNRMDGLVFQSEGARDFFDSSIKKKSVVIHNSVNVPQDKYPIPTEREKRIVNVGRLHPQKNQKLLIDAFAQVEKDFPDYVLEIYGDGGLKDELQLHVEFLQLQDRVHLNASRKDIWDCISKASLFVLTSDYEGMPNALMEAMALGLPCIATNCRPGGARTLIEDGVNGFVVPLKDLKGLVDKMVYMLSHSDEAEHMAQNARKLQETHSDKAIFDQWNNYLFQL
jgi:glycosyltransferase involved in cell wall biosynthesis